MSSTAKAIQRFLKAASEGNPTAVLLSEPSLLTPEADKLLEKYERDALKAGDKDSAAVLAEIRDVLRTLRKSLSEYVV